MSNFKELEEFLRRQKDTEQKVNGDLQKENFIHATDAFYSRVQDFLIPLVDEGLLAVDFVNSSITADYVGTYDMRTMLIKSGNQRVTIFPVGSAVIGAYGRIDMRGDNGRVTFLWVPRSADRPRAILTMAAGDQRLPQSPSPKGVPPAERAWKIATPPPDIRFIDLNPESFSDALMSVLHE